MIGLAKASSFDPNAFTGFKLNPSQLRTHNHYTLQYHSVKLFLNPFLFIRGFSCPSSVQTTLTQNAPNSHFCQQWAVTPDQESSTLEKTCAKLLLLSAEGCHIRLDGQHYPLKTYHGVFFKGGETR
jgi:hypothetical protein